MPMQYDIKLDASFEQITVQLLMLCAVKHSK